MQTLSGRVATITGAASGIGLALARRCAREGMSLALGDIEAEPLERARAEFEAAGTPVLAQPLDVTDEAQVQRFADAAYQRFGAVHLLCNNAGVASRSLAEPIWEIPLADWRWILDVNVMGVVHGLRAFVPRMISGGRVGHVVNTASVAGLLAGSGPYHASKHAVVCLTEGLYRQFRTAGTRLSASVLCPGLVRTEIMQAERNRQAAYGEPADPATLSPATREWAARFREALSAGFTPGHVADAVLDGVLADRFYIVPAQTPIMQMVQLRLEDIAKGRNPSLPPPAVHAP